MKKINYEILKEDVRPSVTNFYIFYKEANFTKDDVSKFALSFRKERDTKCNIHIIDSMEIVDFMDIFTNLPKKQKELKADHFIATLFFDTNNILWYPFKEK